MTGNVDGSTVRTANCYQDHVVPSPTQLIPS